MNILVCISRVPDTTSKITIENDSKNISTQGLKFVVNPFDEFAIEEALRIRTAQGGSITVVTVGGEVAKDVLRTALALSVDKAVLIKTDNSLDSYSVARAIAEFAKSEKFDLILTGKQSIDYSSGAVPQMLGEFLNMPVVSVVTKLSIENNKVVADREIESGIEVVETSLPCLITAQKGLNEPRYPKLPDIMKAKQKKIEEIPMQESEELVSIVSINTVQKSRTGKIFGSSREEIAELVHQLQDTAKVI